MNSQFLPTIRVIIAAAWRRRYLLVLPVMLMLPMSVIWALYGPRTYLAKSLMLLQESGPTNPLSKDVTVGGYGYSMQMRERMAGLQALLRSDRVLGNVYRDLAGDQVGTPREIEAWKRSFSALLSVELVGTDFLEFQLKGSGPRGLGKRLEVVTARFLEALLPEQNALYASQVLFDKRREELDSAERALASFRHRLAERLPNGLSAPYTQLAELRSHQQAKEEQLHRITQEIGERRARLPAPSVRIEHEIAQVRAEMATIEATGGEPQARFSQVKGQLMELIAIRDMEVGRSSLEAEVRELVRQVDAAGRVVRQSQPLAQQQAQLEREVAEAKAAYEEYARRYQRVATVRSSGVLNAPERIKLIDAPRDPEFPATSALRIPIMVMLASVLLGLGLSIGAELLDQRMRRPEEAVEATGLPLLGRLA